jgi:hypothetical protein
MNIALESQKFLNIGDFFRTLQACLAARFGKDALTFTAAYPNTTADDLTTPLLTYYYRQEPGTYGKTVERKPRHAGDESVILPDGRPATVGVNRQRFEYFTTFEVWERDGVAADELATTLRQYILSLTAYFQRLGLGDILFVRMDGTQSEHQWKTDLVRRELVFQIVLDEFTNLTSPTMLAFSVEGFVYRSLYHMIEKDGTSFNQSVLEAQDQILTASGNPEPISIPGSGDPVVIQLLT